MAIEWRSQLSIGNKTIDDDHQGLIRLFNLIEECLNCDSDKVIEQLPILFNKLFIYTKDHFAKEEIIQIEMQYAKYQEHKAKHQEIIQKLEEANNNLQDLIAIKSDTEEFKSSFNNMHTEIIALAKKWVIDHVIITDREMIPYLKHQKDIQSRPKSR